MAQGFWQTLNTLQASGGASNSYAAGGGGAGENSGLGGAGGAGGNGYIVVISV